MENLKSLLSVYGVQLKKQFGQNFLTDESLLSRIVEKAGVNEFTTVLEIGCGAGTLTSQIAKKAKKVIGYEIDTRLKPVLEKTVGDKKNVEIVFKDVMKEKLADLESKLGDDYVMVANLPYYITTPIVMRFLEQSTKIKGLVIMIQEEVAQRFCAKPSSTDYGAITVGINLRGSASVIEYVPRQMFTPPPNVDSAVIKIDVEKNKFLGADLEKVREVVKAGFSSRRKMLVNNLMNFFKMDRATAESRLTEAGVKLTSRAENLSASDFVALTNAIFNG
ncbi:MAG: ribosomal RNA small subunit methyltransferase A [Clostridia bacterium]|nr:ribosomal RNA small subunit methyltransferase A [Clostridia bacterium]